MGECEHCNMLTHTQKNMIGELKSPCEKCASAQIYVHKVRSHCNTNAMEIESLSVHKNYFSPWRRHWLHNFKDAIITKAIIHKIKE